MKHVSSHHVKSQKSLESLDLELYGGISNEEILAIQPEAQSLPMPRTHIYKLSRERRSRLQALDLLDPVAFSYVVTSRRQLHRSFAKSATDNDRDDQPTDLYDVYAIMRPDMLHRILTQSVYHWSLYCNGHYYHLSKNEKLNGAQTILKDEDLSYQGSTDYETRRLNPGRPLMAYHLGKTDYTPEQIRRIAEWIMDRLDVYHLFKSNCQHFVLCLSVRIICYRRDTSVFMGHCLQIVDQDSSKSSPRPSQVNMNRLPTNGFETGFYLAGTAETLGSWAHQIRVKTAIEHNSYQLNLVWSDAVDGNFPRDILEYSRWRRRLWIFRRHLFTK
ncbi:uncharacterized protein N7529_010350 [Penicillium soppii]|uniref:uncharacterized protein n=1 Tax=Penicillium soppii TaxID=69789 RepID=UPI0025475D93|nr:uncharacterized protein N7529_010350 [Penicillium soppii]KAJ5856406.1 hypothetical protein N7529_010350 [Penicillium soppii]